MIQVCLKDGFVVYEFASVAEFKEAFPTGLDADSIASGCFVLNLIGYPESFLTALSIQGRGCSTAE